MSLSDLIALADEDGWAERRSYSWWSWNVGVAKYLVFFYYKKLRFSLIAGMVGVSVIDHLLYGWYYLNWGVASRIIRWVWLCDHDAEVASAERLFGSLEATPQGYLTRSLHDEAGAKIGRLSRYSISAWRAVNLTTGQLVTVKIPERFLRVILADELATVYDGGDMALSRLVWVYKSSGRDAKLEAALGPWNYAMMELITEEATNAGR